MSELKPRITENGIDYILVGDYYIPDLKLPEERRPIGKYGRMHREYLREVHPARLNTLVLTGELWTYLADLNEQAQERLDTIMEQMKATEGVTEELKRTSQMEWVQRCNNIHNRAEEIVLHILIGKIRSWSRRYYKSMRILMVIAMPVLNVTMRANCTDCFIPSIL